jgi:hypothetical protein
MSTHTYHPDTLDVGLSDDCPRCSEHANDPLASLDPAHVDDLWRQMVRVEFTDGGPYRSLAEARACRQLYSLALFLQRIGIDPRAVQLDPPRIIDTECGACATQHHAARCPRCGTPR